MPVTYAQFEAMNYEGFEGLDYAADGEWELGSTTFTRATRRTNRIIRVYADGAIDTATVGTGDFAISGNTVASVDAQPNYVDITFSNDVAIGSTITASVGYGIEDLGGTPIVELDLDITGARQRNVYYRSRGRLLRYKKQKGFV